MGLLSPVRPFNSIGLPILVEQLFRFTEILHLEKPEPERVILPPLSDGKITPLGFSARWEFRYRDGQRFT